MATSNTLVGMELPRAGKGLKAHVLNVDAGIDYLRSHPGKVIGYRFLKKPGYREFSHEIMDTQAAEAMPSDNFSYCTLDDLLRVRERITSGDYILSDEGSLLRLRTV